MSIFDFSHYSSKTIKTWIDIHEKDAKYIYEMSFDIR